MVDQPVPVVVEAVVALRVLDGAVDIGAAWIRWEVDRIQFALRSIESPILLLKGAAYLLADLPLAQGRLVSDVDILVPEASLHQVEAALLAAGWGSLKLDPDRVDDEIRHC